MPPHFLTNFEIQNYYQNNPKFIGVYLRSNLPKTKDGAYGINLDARWVQINRNSMNIFVRDWWYRNIHKQQNY